MNQPNLVPLKAYYFSKDEKLMVYEYMPLGSLSALLYDVFSIPKTNENFCLLYDLISQIHGLINMVISHKLKEAEMQQMKY